MYNGLLNRCVPRDRGTRRGAAARTSTGTDGRTLKKHAWKLIPLARADAHRIIQRIPDQQLPSTTMYLDVSEAGADAFGRTGDERNVTSQGTGHQRGL